MKESRELEIKVNGKVYKHTNGGRAGGQYRGHLITSATCCLGKQYERPRPLTSILLIFIRFFRSLWRNWRVITTHCSTVFFPLRIPLVLLAGTTSPPSCGSPPLLGSVLCSRGNSTLITLSTLEEHCFFIIFLAAQQRRASQKTIREEGQRFLEDEAEVFFFFNRAWTWKTGERGWQGLDPRKKKTSREGRKVKALLKKK